MENSKFLPSKWQDFWLNSRISLLNSRFGKFSFPWSPKMGGKKPGSNTSSKIRVPSTHGIYHKYVYCKHICPYDLLKDNTTPTFWNISPNIVFLNFQLYHDEQQSISTFEKGRNYWRFTTHKDARKNGKRWWAVKFNFASC